MKKVHGGVAALSQGFLLMAYRFAEQGPGFICSLFIRSCSNDIFRHIFERFFAHNEVKITKYLKVCLFLIVFFCVCLCSQDSGSVSLAEFLCTGSRV